MEKSVAELLTVAEIADILRVTPITVRRFIASGRLPAVRVGKAVRVRKEAVEQLLTPIAVQPTRSASGIPRGKPTSADDALWQIVGIGRSSGPTDVSANKLNYLAEAYAAETS